MSRRCRLEPRPLATYTPPSYPTKLAIRSLPELLASNQPRRWRLGPGVAGLLAAAATLSAACGSQSSTACIVVVPPVYLSEEQALVAVREELAQYGVDLSDRAADKDSLGVPESVDLVDSAHRIAVEFVSRPDCDELTDTSPEQEYCDFQEAASSLEQEMAAEAADVHYQAFMDPQMSDAAYAEERLREQVREFAEWLASEGII